VADVEFCPAEDSNTDDPQTNERYVPYVIEPAAGATRTMAAFLLAAYDEDEVNGEERTVLGF
jgi:glycyl-tRNA synthetase